MSISIGELKRAPLEWGKPLRFSSYRGKERVGSFAVELLSVRDDLESSQWNEIRVTYAYGQKFQQTIRIKSTECNFGGYRDWFLCPGCFRRCTTLYIRSWIRCRICHRLSYRTQTEHDVERRLRRIGNRRERLGGNRWIQADFPPKPKRMRWKTYDRLNRQDAYEVSQHFRIGIAMIDGAGGRFLGQPAKDAIPIPIVEEIAAEMARATAPDPSEIARNDREIMKQLLANTDVEERILRELTENAKTQRFTPVGKSRKT